MLLFPLSEGPENDYFIWCLNYLVSRSPTAHPVGYYGGTEAEQLFLRERKGEKKEREGKKPKEWTGMLL